MRKVSLGNSGVKVSALCLGTMYFGSSVNPSTAYAILDEYTQAGGSFLDTANKYASWVDGFAGGESESLLGQWMKERQNRQALFIATKAGLPMPGVEKGLRASQIIEGCEKSLQRLQTDVIDLYYAHADDRETPLEESLQAFDSLVKVGKVRFIGASNYYSWRMKESLMISKRQGLSRFCCLQLKYSYLQPRAGVAQDFAAQVSVTEEMMDLCGWHGLTLLAYSPLMGGVFGRDDKTLPVAYDNEDNYQRIQKIRSLAKQLNRSPNQIVLAWLMQHQNPTVIPVLGVSTIVQIHDNLGSLDVHLKDEHTHNFGI
jgi:aryl-alcohol dehydrogenase-like predicted oxidoreductase